jgi:hypothetical protein
MDSQSRAIVSRLKQDELRYRSRLGWSLVAWFIGGMVVGLVAWFLHKPMDRDETAFGAVLGALVFSTEETPKS